MIKQGKYASASAVQLWDVDRTWSLVGVFLVVVVFCLILGTLKRHTWKPPLPLKASQPAEPVLQPGPRHQRWPVGGAGVCFDSPTAVSSFLPFPFTVALEP